VNAIRKYLSGVNSVAATVWSFSFTGPLALAYLLMRTDVVHDIGHRPEALTSLGYVTVLAIFGSALSVVLYNILIKKAGVIFASSCTYLIPVVAAFWGVADGEPVNLPQMASIAVIILGVYLINSD
jgi:drug/metabolite transporter (DMT)-like permease